MDILIVTSTKTDKEAYIYLKNLICLFQSRRELWQEKLLILLEKLLIEINYFSQCYALMGIFFKGLFASGGEDSIIGLFSVEINECVKEINRCHEGSINRFAKIKNGTSFAQDGNIKIWNV